WYCVISPEGCAAILWKDRGMAERAAEQLKLTAKDLIALEVVDEIIPEPLGGAHRDPQATFKNVGEALEKNLAMLRPYPVNELLELRYRKFRVMGKYIELQQEQQQAQTGGQS
ncbi:MAG: hypothetical protein ACPL7D_13275, partial [Candidatus Sumerlaeaceae bacterium]